MAYPATTAEFKARFARDFTYGPGADRVMDGDIANAMTDANAMFNAALFTAADGKTAFLLAVAHFVVSNIQAAGGLGTSGGLGIENEAAGVVTQQSVGGASLSFMDPPDIVKKSPSLLQFWKTDYGRKYLAMVTPRIVGAFGAVYGPKAPDTSESPDVPFADY